MQRYEIFDKGTGAKVYEYYETAPVAWADFPFDLYDHMEVVDTPVDLPAPLFPGMRNKLTKLQYRKLLLPEEETAIDLLRATVETDPRWNDDQRSTIRTIGNKYNEATYMDLDDPDQEKCLMFFVSIGVISSATRVQEILNG